VSSKGALVGAPSGQGASRRLALALVGVGLAVCIGLVSPGSTQADPGFKPTAEFTAIPNPAIIGETVQFNASASADDGGLLVDAPIETYEWDLDGDTSNGSAGFEVSEDDPMTSTTYSSPGDVVVRLRVTDSEGDISDPASLTLHVDTPPVADFIFAPSSPDVNEQIIFDSTSTDPDDGSIASFEWDFESDGTIDKTGDTVTHSFATPGDRQVTLRVTDSDGLVSEVTKTVTVPAPAAGNGPPGASNRPPEASFRISPRPPTAGRRTELISTSVDPDGPIASLAWDLDGDGEFDDGSGGVVKHKFSKGEARVGLRVVDGDGAADSVYKTITFERSAPLLTPFPIVRLAGELRPSGATEIEKLSVRAPKGAEVEVRCKGKDCPFRQDERGAKTARVKFPKIERVLDPGVIIKVLVSERGMIGKFTRFKLRDGKPPKRTDRCLAPNGRKPIACPSS
jgi:PKD repeat protein